MPQTREKHRAGLRSTVPDQILHKSRLIQLAQCDLLLLEQLFITHRQSLDLVINKYYASGLLMQDSAGNGMKAVMKGMTTESTSTSPNCKVGTTPDAEDGHPSQITAEPETPDVRESKNCLAEWREMKSAFSRLPQYNPIKRSSGFHSRLLGE